MTTEPCIWIGTSWKMNKTLPEALTFAEKLAGAEAEADNRIQRFVIPGFTMIRQVKEKLKDTKILVGAQNMHWEAEGAWTGEISAPMLTDCGMDMVELGHSERREHFGDTDKTVGLKVEAAVRHRLIPLICIGETLADRENGEADLVLERQVLSALAGLKGAMKSHPVLLAYEPVWAIGAKGIPATADYAEARHAKIKSGAKAVMGRDIPCLYGGSVNPGNCAELASCPHIDGLFIGRAAWEAEGYLDILGRVSASL